MHTFLTPQRSVVFSFAALIFIGTLVLMLPVANAGAPLSLVDALFTATSATCVTGLVVVDTGPHFTLFGQLAILTMIQLGGLGIMTFSTAFLYILEGRFSLTNREILQETLNQRTMHGLLPLLKTVFLATISIESIGALILSVRYMEMMPVGQAVYFGVFHAVSAFCNAGFALFPDSFEAFKGDFVINFTLMALIVLGGLGFVVLYEIRRLHRWRRHGLSLHTRLVLITSLGLILAGAMLFFVLEAKNVLANEPWPAKIVAALFQSITARTAGFNSVNITVLSNPTLFMLIVLMFIGASPASCGGGIKTTTFAVILSHMRARFHNQTSTNIFFRRIPPRSVGKAITITFFSSVVIALGTLLLLITEVSGLSHLETRGQFLELLFEVTSAFATVGLSTGATPMLSTAGRIIITIVMFIGRLGPLTLALAVGAKEQVHYRYVEEDVMIG